MKSEAKQGLIRPVARIEYFDRRKTLHAAEAALSPSLDEFSMQLGTWKDDRAVDALVAILKELSEGKTAKSLECQVSTERCMIPIDSLLAHGSHESLDAVIQSFHVWHARSVRARSDSEKANGKKGVSDSTSINASLRALTTQMLSVQIHNALGLLAGKHGVALIPKLTAPSRTWREWAAGLHSVLPEKLGRVATFED